MINNSNSETNYFKVGAFVLVGFGLIVFALLIFGSEKVFEPVVYVETYFEESIQGVSRGSPVKYRGLQIGYVDNISFTSEMYPSNEVNPDNVMYTRAIYIKIAITSKLFTSLSDEEVKRFLSHEVDQGLRIKLVAQGLTGICYLEFNYVDPKKNPIHKPEWMPKNFYIPSVTSTLTRLSENAQYIMNELKDVDFKKIFSNFSTLIDSFEVLTDKAQDFTSKADNFLNQVENPVVRSMQNLKIISQDLRLLSDRLKLKPSEIIFSSYPPPLDPNKL